MGTASQAIAATQTNVPPPTGFQDLYRTHAETVYKTALRVTGNPADAEDVLQSVFLRLLDHQPGLDPMRSPEAYLRRAATNASIDVLRRKAATPETAVEAEREYGSKESSVLQKLRVRHALSKLPPEDAELFVLCYLEGYSYAELADQFQMERGTVASRLFRIRAVLQKDLSQ